MRNITVSNIERHSLNFLKYCEVFCVNDRVLYAYGQGIVSKYSDNNEEIICDLKETLYPGTKNDSLKALDINYHYEKDALYLILKNGDIISIEKNEEYTLNIVGSVSDSIQAVKWSPEQELIAVVDGADNIILLSSDFDTISETPLHGGGFGEKQIITVGWGSKETQFQGSAGKYKAEDKEEIIFSNTNRIVISWRGDAEYFAVSSINPEKNLRYIKIFNKNGVLQSTSECINGLDDSLDWRSSGNLIATTQKHLNKYIVSFFEKNGMKHGDFKLATNEQFGKVSEICWSKDSKILAVALTDSDSEKNSHLNDSEECGNYIIQFYTVSNYKWYYKYTITINNSTSVSLKWDDQRLSDLHIVVNKKFGIEYFKYSWLWVISKSKVNCESDESFVAVINGCNVQLTSFKKGIIPPPMYSSLIQLNSPVNFVSFAKNDKDLSPNDFMLLLSDGTVLIYKYFLVNKTLQCEHKLIGTLKLPIDEGNFYYNGIWFEKNKLLLSSLKVTGEKSKPILNMVSFQESDLSASYEIKEILLQSTVAILKFSKSTVIVYDNDGMIYSLKSDNLTSVNSDKKNKMILDLEIFEQTDGKLIIFSLDNFHKFYVNGELIFNNILSFHIHDAFILLTNFKQELISINYEEINIFKVHESELFKRKIERGSRIITSVYKDLKVILQMPRGNLECIQPRALSVYAVGKFLDSLKYAEAFNLMRKQRINLNLIYDHNPLLFANNVDSFLREIEDPQWISLFISDITEEDLTKTTYAVAYKKNNNALEKTDFSKISTVCNLLEKALSKINNSEKYLLPILTCLIKRNKIEFIEAALLKLKSLKEKEMQGIKSSVTFDEAFKYVLYLIDVDELYNIALGMYDFDLVLIVANKSQKDPKEYLPFLNNLKSLEPHYQKYSIDKYLKRYKKALENLIQCDEIDECITFIKSHQLYKYALKLVPQNTDKFKNICVCYGEELMKGNHFEEAGIMFAKAGLYKNAIDAYKKSGNWREVISCANELKFKESELNELYYELAENLIACKQFMDASLVYKDYIKDITECSKTLALGKYFDEAYRICALYNCKDYTKEMIYSAAVHQAHSLGLHIDDVTNTIEKQKNRLLVVRQNKLLALESKPDYDIDSDAYSDASTIITRSNASTRLTNKTYRSAKNKRKQERKLLSLKEGSPYEDLALLTSLYNLVTNSLKLSSEVGELNKFLVKINEYELAEKLQSQFKQLLKKIENSKNEIWTPDCLLKMQESNFNSTSNELALSHTQMENAPPSLFNLKYSIPPETQLNVSWELDLLKP
ncbi:elongator complex protein, putative [Pediculus humanus corporis]|uniref:Elongator complex protein 1 n=1 Tax=Pediculus humanus subsp. corporis TaxID=121224 RepID=E0VW26_PEDHC|nr:elongator complex protein, putative [Pediculus humanus corporis]EEB17582.1 elongator complex protein, putative [Pediculus humanus corporis]